MRACCCSGCGAVSVLRRSKRCSCVCCASCSSLAPLRGTRSKRSLSKGRGVHRRCDRIALCCVALLQQRGVDATAVWFVRGRRLPVALHVGVWRVRKLRVPANRCVVLGLGRFVSVHRIAARPSHLCAIRDDWCDSQGTLHRSSWSTSFATSWGSRTCRSSTLRTRCTPSGPVRHEVVVCICRVDVCGVEAQLCSLCCRWRSDPRRVLCRHLRLYAPSRAVDRAVALLFWPLEPHGFEWREHERERASGALSVGMQHRQHHCRVSSSPFLPSVSRKPTAASMNEVNRALHVAWVPTNVCGHTPHNHFCLVTVR